MSLQIGHAAILISTALLLGAAPCADAAEIYRWIDDKGDVHYGNVVPDAQKQQAQKVDTQGTELTDAQRLEAEKRLAKDRAQADAMAQQRKEAAKAGAARPSAAGASRTADTKGTCEDRWRRYRESDACFAPYRLANGGVKAEAFQKCVEVKVPVLC